MSRPANRHRCHIPIAQVVEGFAPLMPSDFAERLSDDDIDALIAYITEPR